MNLRSALLDQAQHCAALDSPFMAKLLPMLADVWPGGSALDRVVASFDGDIGPKGHSLPLRLASGLHALVLTGQDADLVASYPPFEVADDALKDRIAAALETHEAFLLDWITSPPQTNEVRRSAALIAGTHALVRLLGVPDIQLSELGASAGLNLMFDRYALHLAGTCLGPQDAALTLSPDWNGTAPERATFQIRNRRGVDLLPLDPHRPDHALRLRAYLWPDQAHRRALTDAAIEAHDATVDPGDALAWLEHRLERAPEGHMHLITHTIAWQYFPKDRQETGEALIEAAGAKATASSPLAWLRMEADDQTRGAAITARVWPGDHALTLGRSDFHGRWVDWNGTDA